MFSNTTTKKMKTIQTGNASESWEWIGALLQSRVHPPPLIMGIVNVTPDSFYDGGNFSLRDNAVEHGLRLLAEGADILDIGGESTRPPGRDYGAGSTAVSVEEEIERVVPVIEEILSKEPEAMISIDTMKPQVAGAAIKAGAGILNDVSAGEYDEEIWDVAAEADIPCILMHGHNPVNREPVDRIEYDDVVTEVIDYLRQRIERARSRGVRKPVADPGIGFAKGAGDSERLIRELGTFGQLGVPLLIGASRKSFVGRRLGGLPPSERLYGTLGAHAAAVLNGGTILRVHDVRPAVEFFGLFGILAADHLPFTEGFRAG